VILKGLLLLSPWIMFLIQAMITSNVKVMMNTSNVKVMMITSNVQVITVKEK
jgi:hypothetical protein